jgi:hypothetical protein
MHSRLLALLLVASPALAAKKPPPPPLPPLVLDAAAPIVTVTIDGQPLRLRVDGGATRHVELNSSAARRLGLDLPDRLVGGQPVDRGRSITQVGKVSVKGVTTAEVVEYAGRLVPMTMAWNDNPAEKRISPDFIADADGVIGPWLLPHDSVRIVRRPVAASDRETVLPLRWSSGRGMLGRLVVGDDDVDIVITPLAATSIATAAAAAILAVPHGGQLKGPARDVPVAHGVARPVRDVVFAKPVDAAGVRLPRVAARVFDWSGKTQIPDADLGPDEAVVAGRAGAQSEWAKLAIGNDHLANCAEIGWTRLPLAYALVCPALPQSPLP